MVYEMSGSKELPSVADGKRRKVVEDDDDAPPTFALDSTVAASPVKSVPASPAKSSLAPKPAIAATPARPSPLWQVSQAGESARVVTGCHQADLFARRHSLSFAPQEAFCACCRPTAYSRCRYHDGHHS